MPDPVARVTACTVTTRRGLPAARAAVHGYRAHHPGHEVRVVAVDEPGALDWLGLPAAEIARLTTGFAEADVLAVVTALALAKALDDADVVVALPAESSVHAPLTELVGTAADHGVAVVPRLLSPVPRDGLMPDDGAVPGLYDREVFAVGTAGKSLLEHLADPARLHAVGDAQALFDRAVSHAPHGVVRDPGIAVGYWNAHERPPVAGGTLRLFRYPGHDPRTPWLLSADCVDEPRVKLSAEPALRALCAAYRDAVGQAEGPRYAFDSLPDGTAITPVMRALYRAEWLQEGNPPADLVEWLRGVDSPAAGAAGLNRLLVGLWLTRTDLQVAFAHPTGAHAEAYRSWCRTHGVAEGEVPAWALPADPPPPVAPVDEFGVNLAGYLTGELGLGEMGRIVHDAIRAAGVPVATVVEEQALTCGTGVAAPASAGPPRFPVSVLAVNSDYTALLLEGHPDVGRDRHRIGLWAWELSEFPPALHAGFGLVDEVWTVSEFCREAIAAHSPVPVKVFPVPVGDPGPVEKTRGDVVRFLFAFDFNSTMARKNPDGVVTAFQRAFPGRDDVRLTLKTSNGSLRVPEAERLRHLIADDPRIELLDRYLSAEEFAELYASSDAYVSLHRSEGFGLTVAEAMARGLPVIATAYSATTEFLDERTGWPIPHTLVAVGPDAVPYPPDGVWADPDLDAAATAMRTVADDLDEAARRGRAAREHVLSTRSRDAAAEWVRTQIRAAHERWRSRGPEHQAGPLQRASAAVHRKVDAGAPSRIPFARGLRRAVLRTIDHYDAHQRDVLSTVVGSFAEAFDALESRVGGQARELADAKRRLAEAEAELARLARERDERGR